MNDADVKYAMAATVIEEVHGFLRNSGYTDASLKNAKQDWWTKRLMIDERAYRYMVRLHSSLPKPGEVSVRVSVQAFGDVSSNFGVTRYVRSVAEATAWIEKATGVVIAALHLAERML